MPSPAPLPRPVTARDVFGAWWPLAASWLLMGLELPAVSAVMARLADPQRSLAAYGGVVFPLALLIESPILMLLSASTALSRDGPSYRMVRGFMFGIGITFTALHALVAFTPLYDFVAGRLLGAPAEILEPARLGLRIMTPWTIAIAYRRTQQGVLIRFGASRMVGVGTAVRLGTLGLVLAAGSLFGSLPGIVVGTLAVATGVVSEALFSGFAVRPVLDRVVKPAPVTGDPLTASRFLRFYAPLAVTPLLLFFTMPLATAAMSRMPRPLDSLAAWPVVIGAIFTMRSLGFAFNEVVVSMLDRPGAAPALRRFAAGLGAATSAALLVAAVTPLGGLWFGRVSALPPALAALAAGGLAIGCVMPALSAGHSLYQGALVHGHRTRGVTEAMAISLAVTAGVLGVGVAAGRGTGLHVAMAAIVAGAVAQLAWLARRAGPVLRAIESGR